MARLRMKAHILSFSLRSSQEFNHEFSGLATISHTAAIIIGVGFARAAGTLKKPSLEHVKEAVLQPLAVLTLVSAFFLCLEGVFDVFSYMASALNAYLAASATAFAHTIESLIAGTNIFSTSVMTVFYVGLLSTGYGLWILSQR